MILKISCFIYDDPDQLPDLYDKLKERARVAQQKGIELPWTNLVIDDIIHEPDGIMSDELATATFTSLGEKIGCQRFAVRQSSFSK